MLANMDCLQGVLKSAQWICSFLMNEDEAHPEEKVALVRLFDTLMTRSKLRYDQNSTYTPSSMSQMVSPAEEKESEPPLMGAVKDSRSVKKAHPEETVALVRLFIAAKTKTKLRYDQEITSEPSPTQIMISPSEEKESEPPLLGSEEIVKAEVFESVVEIKRSVSIHTLEGNGIFLYGVYVYINFSAGP
jgi:hypothetical protein